MDIIIHVKIKNIYLNKKTKNMITCTYIRQDSESDTLWMFSGFVENQF